MKKIIVIAIVTIVLTFVMVVAAAQKNNEATITIDITDSTSYDTEEYTESTNNDDAISTEETTEEPIITEIETTESETIVEEKNVDEEKSESSIEYNDIVEEDPIIYSTEYTAYIPDNYNSVIFSVGNYGIISSARAIGEDRFAIFETNDTVRYNDISRILEENNIEFSHVVLTGNGTVVWTLAKSNYFSACAPISGNPIDVIGGYLKTMPVNALMSPDDPVYIRAGMRDTVTGLTELYGNEFAWVTESYELFSANFFAWASHF